MKKCVDYENQEPVFKKFYWTACVFKSNWWRLHFLLYPACWVMTRPLSHPPLEELITSEGLLEDSGDGWKSGRVDGLWEAYTNTGSTALMWEVLCHLFSCFCLTPHFSFFLSLLKNTQMYIFFNHFRGIMENTKSILNLLVRTCNRKYNHNIGLSRTDNQIYWTLNRTTAFVTVFM